MHNYERIRFEEFTPSSRDVWHDKDVMCVYIYIYHIRSNHTLYIYTYMCAVERLGPEAFHFISIQRSLISIAFHVLLFSPGTLSNSNLLVTSDGLQPGSDGLQPRSNGLQATCGGLQPNRHGKYGPSPVGWRPLLLSCPNEGVQIGWSNPATGTGLMQVLDSMSQEEDSLKKENRRGHDPSLFGNVTRAQSPDSAKSIS